MKPIWGMLMSRFHSGLLELSAAGDFWGWCRISQMSHCKNKDAGGIYPPAPVCHPLRAVPKGVDSQYSQPVLCMRPASSRSRSKPEGSWG